MGWVKDFVTWITGGSGSSGGGSQGNTNNTTFDMNPIEELKQKVQAVENTAASIKNSLEAMKSTVENLPAQLQAFLTNLVAPAPTPLPPMDPSAALTSIAQGIKNAESILNQNGLLIANGNVSVEVAVKDPLTGGAGAKAVINFQIGTKPIQ
ncbi:MAG: hypothetical protein JWP27_852 [Flaviaesturariibacter sp.]|nr:hypothetical protein [Flaviaesturariibacter sp.]